jgi:pimeloyl-ACP methyl ester carboxylesterase
VDVLLLHAGIADHRMWAPQLDPLSAAGFRTIAPDLRGFGDNRLDPEPFSYARDVLPLLDGAAAVVGASQGGRVALEVALLAPEQVRRLVVIAPGLPGWSWSDETRAGWAEEETAYERGDLDAAAEASARLWLDRPGERKIPLDPGVRSIVLEMILRSYEQQAAWDEGAGEEAVLDPPVQERLGEIGCPTLVLVGEFDVPDMRAIAAHVAESIPDAELGTVAGAAHLPSLEQPELVNARLLDFLG